MDAVKPPAGQAGLFATVPRLAARAKALAPALPTLPRRRLVEGLAVAVAALYLFPALLVPLSVFALGATLTAAFLLLALDRAQERDAHLRARRRSSTSRHRSQSRTGARRASAASLGDADAAAAALLADSVLDDVDDEYPVPPIPARYATSTTRISLQPGRIERLDLALDNGGALDRAVATLRDAIVRDFVLPWYTADVAAPGSEAARRVFPTAVAATIDTVVMKAAGSVSMRAPQELLVAAATRSATDMVAHMRAFHAWYDEAAVQSAEKETVARASTVEDGSTRASSDPHAAAFHAAATASQAGGWTDAPALAAALARYTATHPTSALARAVDTKRQAAAMRRVARRLLRMYLPAQDCAHPLLFPMYVELACTALLWPIVKKLAAPRTINALLVTALAPEMVAVPRTVPVVTAYHQDLCVRLIQTRSHDAAIAAVADPAAFFLTVLFRGSEKKALAKPPGPEGSTDASLIFDASINFTLRKPIEPTEQVILQLCKATSPDASSFALVAETEVGLKELPHVGWVAFHGFGGPMDGVPPMAELWLELERVDPAPAVAAPPKPVESGRSSPAVPDIAPAAADELSTLPEEDEEEECDEHQHVVQSPDMVVRELVVDQDDEVEEEDEDDWMLDESNWTLDKIEAHPALYADFAQYLAQRHLEHLVQFLSAVQSYKALTTLLDPADPMSRAAVQQEAYDLLDAYFTGPRAVQPPHQCRHLEEQIVLDPSPAVFDPAVYLVRHTLQVDHLASFMHQHIETTREIPALIRATAAQDARWARSRVGGGADRTRRAHSLSTYDRARPRGAPPSKIQQLATKHTKLVEGVTAYDDAFVVSSMTTFQTQYMVVEALLMRALTARAEEHANAPPERDSDAASDDAVSRLLMQKTQIECQLMMLEQIMAGGHARPASVVSTHGKDGHHAGAHHKDGGALSGLASSASALTANMGMGMKKAFKGLGERRSGFGSKFLKKKGSTMSLQSVTGTSAPASPASTPSAPAAALAALRSSVSKDKDMRRAKSEPPLAHLPAPAHVATAVRNESAPTQGKLARVSSRLGRTNSAAKKATATMAASSEAKVTASTLPTKVAATAPTSTESVVSTSKPSTPAASPVPAPAPLADSALPSSASLQVMDVDLTAQETTDLIEAAFAVLKLVFALDGTLRARIFGLVKQVLRPTLGTHLKAHVAYIAMRLSQPEFYASAINDTVLATLWPNGIWHGKGHDVPNDPAADAAAAARALALVEAALPDRIAHVLGKSAATAGLRATFAMVQVDALNQGLLVQLLESLAEVLVPFDFDADDDVDLDGEDAASLSSASSRDGKTRRSKTA
ncbi:hypothetical protein GGF31_003112 [Allomyces arbusculus]|nr:hypothetical protein GGF31_003112 [Allomyces arbusculus]